MRKLKIKQISLAVCLALMPIYGFSAGLGKLNVSSGLGEPLKAEIELLSVTADELSTLVATIASEEAYAAQGITRLGIHNSIQVELTKSANGSPVLKLRSNQPISDPYLDMLIQVDWASGRLQREYTVLLDPPGYKQSIDNVVAMPIKPPSVNTSSNSSGNTSTNSTATNNVDGIQAPVGKSKQARKNTPAIDSSVQGGQALTTQRGDTLSLIAKQTQLEGVSLDQMLIGLYENNKAAFTEGNMNRLKVGQIIKVPSKESLTSISTSQASQSVKIHSSNWNSYRNTLAGAVAVSPAMETLEQKQSASGKVGVAEDKATPAATGQKDVVKLSSGDKALSKNGDASAKSLQAKVAALEEETTARENSLKEAQERTAILEKQVQDMQKLLAMKSQSMSDAEKNAEATKGVANLTPETKLEEKPTTPGVDGQKTEEVVTPVANENAVADSTNIVNPPIETPAAVVPPPVVKNPVTSSQSKPAPIEEEPSFLSGLMNSVDLAVLGGIGGVALLGAGWMFLRNKRRKDLDSFERGILTSGGLRANTVFGNTTGNASTSDTSFLTDFAQSADGSMIDTNDVDPIAEAEVYMAYGRDAQAEEILKDAISKEPKRYELHLKLLEMYAARKDTSAFEAIAGELYTTLGADDPVWIKVAEIGVTMEPENPLYDVSKSAVLAALATGAIVGSVPKTPVTGGLAADGLDGEDLDFSFDNDVDTQVSSTLDGSTALEIPKFSATQNNVEHAMSFDMDSVDDNIADLGGTVATSENNDSANMLDFTTELDADSKSVTSDSVSDTSMDFDLGEFKADSIIEESKPIFDDVTSINEFAAPVIDLVPTIDSPEANEKADSQTLDFDMDFTDFTSQLSDEVITTAPISNVVKAEEVSSSADDMSFDFDLGSVTTIEVAPIQDELASSEISFDLPSFDLAEDSYALPDEQVKDEFSLDDELLVEELNGEKIGDNSFVLKETELSEEAGELEANSFDLSTINLDLNETTTEFTLPEVISIPSFEITEPETVVIESPDVDIKLDLVAAYIDMDDKEGARELLEEVIKEGGIQQQLRAQQLLASLT